MRTLTTISYSIRTPDAVVATCDVCGEDLKPATTAAVWRGSSILILFNTDSLRDHSSQATITERAVPPADLSAMHVTC